MLTEEQKKKQIDISRVNLGKFQTDEEIVLSRFVTMDHIIFILKPNNNRWLASESPHLGDYVQK